MRILVTQFSWLVLFCYLPAQIAFALPNVKFIETSVEFQDNQRSARLTLLNQGDEAANVEVKMQYKVYEDSKDGVATTVRFVDLDKMTDRNYPYNLDLTGPNKIIRFSPRRAVIEPGQRQAFRIFLNKPLDLLEGEYTIYLDVHYILDDTVTETKANHSTAIDLPIQFSYSIPLQIFHGKLTGRVTDLKFKQAELMPKTEAGDKEVKVVLSYQRTGNASIGIDLDFYRNDEPAPFYSRPEIIENYRPHYNKAYVLSTKKSPDSIRIVAKAQKSNKVLFDVTKPVTATY
jgi:P pilus assembly chaperone PapD